VYLSDVSDYLIYATNEGIYGLYIEPSVTSQPFPPITAVTKVTAFDVSFENKTLIAVSDFKLKKFTFDDNEVTDLVTAVNMSGLFCAHLCPLRPCGLMDKALATTVRGGAIW